MYTSFETIPIKLFFKIQQTKKYHLLGDEKPKEVWENIVEEFNNYNTSSETTRNFELLKKISLQKSRYKATVLAVEHLRQKRDIKLEELLRRYHYNLTEENFYKDLNIIESNNKGILVIVKELESGLIFSKKGGKIKPSELEDLITAYCYKSGMSFDSNKITASQFYSLQKLALKIK